MTELSTTECGRTEKCGLDFFCAELIRLGFDHVWMDKSGSVIGMVEGAQPGPTLLLDGHCDTVDGHCDTVDAHASDWTYDPWGGEIANGRLYGRGAAEMKGSLAAMAYTVGQLDRDRLRGRVAVSATVSEEVAEGLALKSVIEAVQPDFVIIGEATGLNLNRGGRGRAEIQVTTFGRAAHSSSPEAGRCAVADMQRVIQAITSRLPAVDPVLGAGSIVLTDIISSPYPGHSVVPYRCHVTYDRRLLLSVNIEADIRSMVPFPGLDAS